MAARAQGYASSAFLQTVADSRLFCPSRLIASLAARAARKPHIYVYNFAVGPRYNDFLSVNQTGFDLVPPDVKDGFAAHANDVWFRSERGRHVLSPRARSLLASVHGFDTWRATASTARKACCWATRT
jgi:hypothetical protein